MNHIEDWLNQKSIDLLDQAGDFVLTESGTTYLILVNYNVQVALKRAMDTNEESTPEEINQILTENGFETTRQSRMYYKYGRIILNYKNPVFIFQYTGKVPKIVSNTVEFNQTGSISSGYTYYRSGLISLNEHMEKNGEFLEPWNKKAFSKFMQKQYDRLKGVSVGTVAENCFA